MKQQSDLESVERTHSFMLTTLLKFLCNFSYVGFAISLAYLRVHVRVFVCVCVILCVCVGVCVCVYVHLLDTCSAVPCLAAMVLVIVYHFLPILLCLFFFSLPFFCFASLFFLFSLSIGGVARSCPNAPPTSVTSRLALSNPISCW